MHWPAKKLGDVASVFNGKTPSRDEQRESGHPVLKIKDVDELGFFKGVFESFVDGAFAAAYSEKSVKSGDTLILNAAHNADYVGSKQFYARSEVDGALATGEWCIVRANQDVLDKQYASFFLQSSQARHEIRKLVKGIHLYPKDVARLQIPLPPPATQKHIARVLEQADQLRKQAQQMESELNQLAQSLFLEMFGDPVTNPKRWATVPYADLCHRITVGIVVRPTDYYVDSGIPALRSLNVRENRIIKENFVYFSEANNVGPLQKTRVYKGDVVLVRSGQPGTAAVVPEELDGVNSIDILISTPIQEKVASNYLAFFFNSSGGKKIVGASERGQIQKHLNVGSLESALIPAPPLSLQEEFVRRLDAIANVRRNAEVNSESINMTFDSLMQRAFNGELTAPERKAA